SVQTITADDSDSYNLAADFFALLTVHRVEDGHGYLLHRHDHRLRPRTDLGVPAATYRIVGSTIVFDPRPATGEYELRYVPRPAVLVADGDEFDGILGWEEYPALYAAVKLLHKENSPQ